MQLPTYRRTPLDAGLRLGRYTICTSARPSVTILHWVDVIGTVPTVDKSTCFYIIAYSKSAESIALIAQSGVTVSSDWLI